MDSFAQADWNLIRAFLTVAEEGSLSAAARRLGASQPTVGRHIHDLEASLGTTLFTRHARGLVPTEAATALLAPAQAMQAAAGKLDLIAAGQTQAETGTVRISTSEMFAHHHMPQIIADLRHKAPGIEIELHATDSSDNLLFREADIAVRMYRPTQLDLITRHLGDIALGFFASKTYIAERGLPESVDDLLTHDLIGFDRSELLLRGMREFGLDVTRSDFKVRCDDQTAYWQLTRAGCGIAINQRTIGLADPTMTPVLPDVPLPSLPLWLTMPHALRHTPRVRRVFDYLVARLKPLSLDTRATSPRN